MSPRITFDFRFQGLYVVANPADEAAVKKLRKVRRQLFINLNQDEIVLHRWECRLWTRSGSWRGSWSRSSILPWPSHKRSFVSCSWCFYCIIPLKLPIVAELSLTSFRARVGAFGDKCSGASSGHSWVPITIAKPTQPSAQLFSSTRLRDICCLTNYLFSNLRGWSIAFDTHTFYDQWSLPDGQGIYRLNWLRFHLGN